MQEFSSLFKVFSAGSTAEIAVEIERLNGMAGESSHALGEREMRTRAQLILTLVFRERGDASINLSQIDKKAWMGLQVPPSIRAFLLREMSDCFDYFLRNNSLPKPYDTICANLCLRDFLDEIENEFENDGIEKLDQTSVKNAEVAFPVGEQLEARLSSLIERAMERTTDVDLLAHARSILKLIGGQEDWARSNFGNIKFDVNEDAGE